MFKTCLAYNPPTKEFPDGLIISSGQDSLIEARQPDKTAESNADGFMVGHSNQVCSLDVNPEAGWIVSGSWDKSARIWQIGRWETEVELHGHTATVWAVVAYNRDTVVTGCADRAIRVFDIRGKLHISFDGKDIVRALAKLPEGHQSTGQIASATNDGVIRFWNLKGALIAELYGHESFIYSLAVLPSGELVSSGEDRTVRIWQGTNCVQVITLPAISVWAVSAGSNGDIIAGSSDKVARIFTRDPKRMANASELAEFDMAVKSSAVPREQVGPVVSDLPGPEFLERKSGTKEGQSQMIKELDGTTTLYQWSMSQQIWIKIGEVVDSTGSSSTKQSFGGKEYDYIFDIDIEDGKPALKLPYNVTQNPYEAATKFLQDNDLPLTYLEETANFIIKNTQGASLGPSSQPSGADPWGTEARYRPGEVPSSSYQPPVPVAPKPSLPHKDYLSITLGKPAAAFRQVVKINSESASPLTASDLENLEIVSKQLETYSFSSKPSLASTPALTASIVAALKFGTEVQPIGSRLAGLDFLRFLAAAVTAFPYEADVVETVVHSGVFDPSFMKSNNKLAMISIRLFSNLLYGSVSGREMVHAHSDILIQHLQSTSPIASTDVSVAIALTTFYLNLAVFITSDKLSDPERSADRGLTMVEELVKILSSFPAADHKPTAPPLAQTTEPAYRGLMALGTVIIGLRREEVTMAAKEIFNVPQMLDSMKGKGFLAEPRFATVVREIRAALT
jgi:phospholipase A-2-activating protein